jgi:uncharacterized membrane protein YfcA
MWVLGIIVFAVSVVFSMLGQGGGTLYTPVQVLFGVPFHTAATTSLFLIMATSLSATTVFRKAHRVDWALALALEAATALGGLAGGLVSGRFSGTTLTLLFAAFVVFAATFMVRDTKPANVRAPWRGLLPWRREFGGEVYRVDLAVALPVSFVAGTVSGLVGVGGGLLKVPMMVLLFGIPMTVAVGSSAFMVGVTATAGFAGHLANGHFDARTSLWLGGAVLLGGFLGARATIHVDKNRLKKGFGWFLIGISAVVVARALMT